MESKKTVTSVRLEKAVLTKAKEKADAEGLTVSFVVNQLLRRWAGMRSMWKGGDRS